MKVQCLRLLALLAVIAASAHAQDASEPKEIAFKLYEGFAIIAQGEIGELHKLSFLIDTGAVPSVVNQRTAERLRLKGAADRNLSALNQTVRVERIILPELRLGSVRAESLSVTVLDLSAIEQRIGVRVDGIIGLDVLGRASFTIDYRKKKLFMGMPIAAGPGVPFEVHHEAGAPYVVVAVEVNGRRLQLLMDTGSDELKLFAARTGEATRGLRTESQETTLNVAGTDTLREVRLAEIHLGAEVFRKQKAYLWDAPESALRDFDGLLGPAGLGLTRITFDLEHGKLLWEK